MTVFVLTPDTVWNRGTLNFRTVPRKLLGRISVVPRRGATPGLWVRLMVENQFLRYGVALSPFLLVMAIWPEMALPVSSAPILMLLFIGIVELHVLRIPKARRKARFAEDDALRALDTLAFRARNILADIAARRGEAGGEILLVVDQSDLARVPPLTFVSVQRNDRAPHILSLDASERTLIRNKLFDPAFTERDLHAANLREDVYLRSVAFDTRGVTAHARLSAILDKPHEAAI
ncbi:MAG: hypothetical protein AAFR35_11515 [Pseudomonadota bacterium]